MLKTAFATTDGITIDQHFGWSTRFDVYEVSPVGARLLERRMIVPSEDDETSKIATRLDGVRDCTILVVADIGGAAAATVVATGIHPMKTRSDTSILEFLDRLQQVLAGNPPPWLRKVLRRQQGVEWSPR